MILQQNDHVLFYGDSITDAGRSRDHVTNDGLGWGYAGMCAAQLLARYPELNLSFSNKGISGNRIYDLESRLEEDVLAHEPNVVSFLIGINDTWRRYDSDTVSEIPAFTESFRNILTTLKERGTKLVICEPFLLPIPEDRRNWREDLDPRITACRELAREFGALYLPLDGIFAAAACRQSLAYWLPDGVHPSQAGHALIADKWIELVTGK
ncbi:MAG TPA: SGNH/GDSL hydrolase family protein [Abditibacteriaceae bacterium]|jgi:lysophospholipase L1-like esterase